MAVSQRRPSVAGVLLEMGMLGRLARGLSVSLQHAMWESLSRGRASSTADAHRVRSSFRTLLRVFSGDYHEGVGKRDRSSFQTLLQVLSADYHESVGGRGMHEKAILRWRTQLALPYSYQLMVADE